MGGQKLCLSSQHNTWEIPAFVVNIPNMNKALCIGLFVYHLLSKCCSRGACQCCQLLSAALRHTCVFAICFQANELSNLEPLLVRTRSLITMLLWPVVTVWDSFTLFAFILWSILVLWSLSRLHPRRLRNVVRLCNVAFDMFNRLWGKE